MTVAPLGGVVFTSTVPCTLGVDVVNRIWVFHGTSEYQWAFADSAYVLQNGMCWKVAGWNYAAQVAGYANLQNIAQQTFFPQVFVAAFDISSCGVKLRQRFNS